MERRLLQQEQYCGKGQTYELNGYGPVGRKLDTKFFRCQRLLLFHFLI